MTIWNLVDWFRSNQFEIHTISTSIDNNGYVHGWIPIYLILVILNNKRNKYNRIYNII